MLKVTTEREILTQISVSKMDLEIMGTCVAFMLTHRFVIPESENRAYHVLEYLKQTHSKFEQGGQDEKKS